MKRKLNVVAGAVVFGLPMAAPAQTAPASQSAKSPTTTTQTTTTQTTTQTQSVKLKRATASDIKTGATVYDLQGGTVGTVESSDAEGVVVSTGSTRAKLGLSGFGVGDKGLTIAMTRAELDATAKAKATKP
jgi:hypothetical protein